MKRCVVNSSLEDFESVRRSYKEAVSRRSQQQSVQDEQKQQYRAANKRAEDKIAAEIEKIVRDATSSQFMDKLSVYVNAYAHSQGDVSCTIRVSYGEDYKFDDSTPLVWSWEFEVGKYGRRGEVDRKTSSWSGLNATTLQNIDSLKDSVAALEALAKVDDEYVKSVIYDQAVPYSDYVTQEVDSVDDRDFLARARECVPDIVTGYIGGEEDSCQIGSAGALDVSLLPKAVASGCRLCSMKGRGIFTCVIGNCSMPEVVRMSLDGADAFLLDDPGEFAFLRKRKLQG